LIYRSAATVRHQRIIRTAAAILRSRTAIPTIKALIARHTSRPDRARVRHPLCPLGEPERVAVFRAFDESGVRLRPALDYQPPNMPLAERAASAGRTASA
jgi:dihydrodipicolinate synthase/N-acetylneuraminate lyase